jgi:diguanylate cyclase (GGDEF)-like protein
MSYNISDLKKHNSELLDLLTRHLPDMLWVKDLEGKYVYANQAICDGLLMAKDVYEPIGKGDVFFALREREAHKDKPHWHTFGELCFNSDIDVIEQNKAMKFEEYGNVKGELMYLEVYKAPFYDKDGEIIGTVGAGRDITKLKKIQSDLQESLKTLDEKSKQLEYQASHDLLTDLPNRILLIDRLNQAINLAQRNQQKFALLFMDLDHFKEINDSLGHKIGDKILVEFTKRIQARIRITDTLARLGGDEFCVILNDITNVDSVTDFIVNIMNILKDAFDIDGHTLYLRVSMGVAMYPNDGINADTLLKNTDAAVYKAKESGRNTYSFYDEEMTTKSMQRVVLETELRRAFMNDELRVYFQPQINGRTNKLVGMETLVRWEHPHLGLIAPNDFIPLAESTGMIVKLDRIVMQKALKQFKEWHKGKLNPGKLSLNLAIKQLEEKDFIDFLVDLLGAEQCLYQNIEFEVTETQIMKDPEKSIKILEQIAALGISIAIDDFGTGYSSLSYLKRLPIKKLKIDKSFIDDLATDADDAAITKTIISLCENLNLEVIAEGVETQIQKDFLLENGCELIQGYFYSKPLAAQDMTKFLLKNKQEN